MSVLVVSVVSHHQTFTFEVVAWVWWFSAKMGLVSPLSAAQFMFPVAGLNGGARVEMWLDAVGAVTVGVGVRQRH